MSGRSPDPEPDAEVDQEALLAEYEAEKPARKLSGIPFGIVQVLGVAIALLGLWWVFNPLSKQLYLPLFAMLMIATTFLVYRGWGRSAHASESDRSDNPHLVDWFLAALTIGTFAALACAIASRVCGMTPSSAATTSTTTSVVRAPRARMAVKAS